MNYNALKALLPLAEAVDQGRAPDIPKLVDAFIKADLGPPFAALSQQLLIDLVARLFTLGLDAEGTKLRENYSQHEKQWDWIKRDVGLAYRNIAIMDAIIDRVTAAADHSTALTTKAVIEQYVKVLVPLRDEMLSMDEMERKEDSMGFRPAPIPGKERWAGLVKILGKLTGAMATSIQSLMDRAASELGTGKADEGKATLLIARELIETKILPGLTSADGKKTIGDIKVVIVPTEITDGQGVIRDAFTKGRAVAVSAYTPKQKFVRDLEAPVQHVFARRIDQITTMAQIFGQSDLLRADKPDEKDRVADAAKNAETLKKIFAAGGQLRLESDDDWRAFVVQKYEDMTGTDAKDKATAFRAVIKLLYDYLEAFTVHARFTDIYDQADFKDAYFNRPFPRTLSGQLVHDCGVYAMRVAYILSLVRDELGLQFRFIRLPAHVGLIITGKDMPTFIAHNDHFKEYSPGEIKDLKDQLVAKNIAPADDDQFIGELAAVHFIEGPLDMPFVLSDVPKPGKTDIATQQSLWKEYQKVAKTDVFGPASSDKKSKGFLFHNRYLAITESYREWHNQSLVPFWNVTAPNSWDTFEKALKAGGRTELLGRELLLLLDAHLKEIDSGLSSVNSRLEGIESSEKAIGVQLRGDPKLPGKGTRITTGGRFVLIHAWQEYRDRVATLKADAAAKLDKPFKVAAVLDPGLVPPFIPIAEKFLVIVD